MLSRVTRFVLLALLVSAFPRVVPAAPPVAQLVIAHRGDSSHAPENTLASFDSAVTAGADWVELDVHLSRDGEAIVIHDESVDRTSSGHGKIADLTRAQIQALDAGSWFSPRFAGERIPTLGEVLARMKNRARVLIELKNVHGKSEQLVRRCLVEIQRTGMSTQVQFHTFFVDDLHAARLLAPAINCAFLYEFGDSRHMAVLLAHRLGATGFNPRLIHTQKAVVEQAHSFKMSVWPYVADTVPDFEKAVAIGADGIITNRPADLRAWLAHPAIPHN